MVASPLCCRQNNKNGTARVGGTDHADHRMAGVSGACFDTDIRPRFGADALGKAGVLPVGLSPVRQLLHAVFGAIAAGLAQDRILPVRLSPERGLLSGQQPRFQARGAQSRVLSIGLSPERGLLLEELRP